MENPTGAGQKYNELHRYIISLETELGKMKRTERVRFEMEQRYMSLMESSAFLYAILTPDGIFQAMNTCAENFFGFQARIRKITLQSIAGPGCVAEAEAALEGAQKAPVRFPLSIVRASGALGWLDAEFFASVYQGAPSIQILASDITDQVKKKTKDPSADLKPDENKPEEKNTGFTLEILNAIPEMLLVVNSSERCVEANHCLLNTLKLDRNNVIGHPLADVLQESDLHDERLTKILNSADSVDPAATKQTKSTEFKFYAKDGEVVFLGMKTSRLRAGSEDLTLVSFTDNTKLRRTEEQLKRASTTDATTGILNRQGLERLLSAEAERAARYRGSLALIFMDLDGFRRLNERIGYAASDNVLRELAVTIKSHIRPTDFLGRWSGDEFLIMTPLPMTAAFQLAEKIRDLVQHKILGGNISMTLSAGVAEYRKFMDTSVFIGMAYDAMTEAKRGGGNRTVQAKEDKADKIE